MHPGVRHSGTIDDWGTFRQVVGPRPVGLLRRLGEFTDPILVTGCQRSGTTILTRILTESEGITKRRTGEDEELSGALILAGFVDCGTEGRHCFQTTYVNQNYEEYFDYLGRFKMIWVLRNPCSTVFSLTGNWPAEALIRTFVQSVLPTLDFLKRSMVRLRGPHSVSSIEMACLLYRWKTEQLLQISRRLPASDLLVIDYDDLVLEPTRTFPQIYGHIGLSYHDDCAAKLHSNSIAKRKNLGAEHAELIETHCEPIYATARALIRPPAPETGRTLST